MNIEDTLQAAGIFADLSAKITFRCTKDTGESAQTLLTHCINEVNPDLNDVYISPLSSKTDPLVNRATIEVSMPLDKLSTAADLYKMISTLSSVIHSEGPLGAVPISTDDAAAAFYFWGVARDGILESVPDGLRRPAELLVGLVNNVFTAMGVGSDN